MKYKIDNWGEKAGDGNCIPCKSRNLPQNSHFLNICLIISKNRILGIKKSEEFFYKSAVYFSAHFLASDKCTPKVNLSFEVINSHFRANKDNMSTNIRCISNSILAYLGALFDVRKQF